jgi:acid phosphatase (class A)
MSSRGGALRPFTAIAVLAAAGVMSGLGVVRGQTQARPAAPTGYLSQAQMPDVARIVPPAPSSDDSRFNADMAVYRLTRSMQGSPRWLMAQSDDQLGTVGLFKAFGCVLGVAITRENAPLVTSFVARANVDSSRASTVLKNLYQHKRPFQVVDGPVCVTPETKDALTRNPDYPSGHTTSGWETGLVLAQLAPDLTTPILARARAFGQSRIVCGVHNMSAVEAGWMTATAVFAAQQSSDEFQADLKAAKAELARLRQTGSVDAATCSAEAALVAKDPF